MSLIDRRSYERRKNRVTDEDVQRWVEEEEFERFNRVEMDSFQTEMDSRLEMSRSKAVGSIPLDRPDGV
jgi:hypothetical protein